MRLIKKNILIFFLFHSLVHSQVELGPETPGKVTYQSSQFSYVSLGNTSGLNIGDTLYKRTNNLYIPVLQIKFISSRSCAGVILNGEHLNIGDEVVTRLIQTNDKDKQAAVKEMKDDLTKNTLFNNPKESLGNNINSKNKSSTFRGKFSVQSGTNYSNYSSFSNDQQWRYTFSADAGNIGGSNFSLMSYFYFFYRISEWNNIKNNPANNLRVYDLALKYDFNNSMNVLIGRHLNRKISSLGAIDGLQFEKSWDRYYAGAVAGSRPDYINYGLNAKLFEYGGYVGYTDTVFSGIMDNTLAVLEQTNDFKTDRRFLYFQHTSSILSNLNLFISSEVDIYKKENGNSKNDFSLTSLYFVSRYAPVRWLSLTLSYDARKNIIFYETYKNLANLILDRKTRQGLRFSLNIRPFNNIYVGLNTGYNFQKNDYKPTKNFGGFINYSNVPLINSSLSISATKLLTSCLDGRDYGIMMYKDLLGGFINLTAGYRRTVYKYRVTDYKLNQDIITSDLSVRIIRNIFLSLDYETTLEMKRSVSRIMVDLTTRF